MDDPEFKKEIEEKEELNKVVEVTKNLQFLESNVFRELCELIGIGEVVERFGNAKLIDVSNSSTQEEDSTAIDQVQEAHLLGGSIDSLPTELHQGI